MPAATAIELSGIPAVTVYKRFQLGWSDNRIFSTPPRPIAKKGCGKKRPPMENKHGFRGVVFKADKGRYTAYRMIAGKMYYSCGHLTPAAAHAAYLRIGVQHGRSNSRQFLRWRRRV